MREVSRLMQSQTWPKHVAKYSDSSTDSQCGTTNSSHSSKATSWPFAILITLAEEVEEVWKWLCSVTTACQPKMVEKVFYSGTLTVSTESGFGWNGWSQQNMTLTWKSNQTVTKTVHIVPFFTCVLENPGVYLLKFIRNSKRENKGNHYRDSGLDTAS